MLRTLTATLVVIAALICQNPSAQADPFVYTLSGTGTGNLGSGTFTGTFTITAYGDTSSVLQNNPNGPTPNSYLQATSATISVNGHTMANVTDTLAIGVSPTNGGELAFSNANNMSDNVVVGELNTGFATYDLTTALTLSGTGFLSGKSAIQTDAGTFGLTGTSGSISFQASAVPEPSSLAMLGTAIVGGLGAIARRRRLNATVRA